jgi:hypothetical protein
MVTMLLRSAKGARLKVATYIRAATASGVTAIMLACAAVPLSGLIGEHCGMSALKIEELEGKNAVISPAAVREGRSHGVSRACVRGRECASPSCVSGAGRCVGVGPVASAGTASEPRRSTRRRRRRAAAQLLRLVERGRRVLAATSTAGAVHASLLPFRARAKLAVGVVLQRSLSRLNVQVLEALLSTAGGFESRLSVLHMKDSYSWTALHYAARCASPRAAPLRRHQVFTWRLVCVVVVVAAAWCAAPVSSASSTFASCWATARRSCTSTRRRRRT